jgi:endonuclease G, mitochondrial
MMLRDNGQRGAGLSRPSGRDALSSGRRRWFGVVLACFAAGVASPVLADDARLHTFHCLEACPVGAPENADLVVREIYTLSADPLTKLAVWVAYRITPETIGKSQSRGWSEDPWLAPEETLEEDDYDGANEALGVDRGHQAPLAAFSGTPFWPDTNRLSNITPQASALNQASWQRLEARETRLAQKEKTAVHVLTGPLFERMMPPMPGADERHRVPSGYWKVVTTSDGRMTAFVFDQDTPRTADHCDMRRSLDEVELRARLRLFPMRAAPFTTLDRELGCTAPVSFQTSTNAPVRP